MLEVMTGDSFNEELMKVLNISLPTAISRFKCESKFTTDEITTLKKAYNLTSSEIDEIFFGGSEIESK